MVLVGTFKIGDFWPEANGHFRPKPFSDFDKQLQIVSLLLAENFNNP